MRNDIERLAEDLVHTVVDNRLTANQMICDGVAAGTEGIYQRLLAAAAFTPMQLRVVEYLMNESADALLGDVLSHVDGMLSCDELRLNIQTADGGRAEVGGPNWNPEVNLLVGYAAIGGWRARYSRIRQRQAELATLVNVGPKSLDVDQPC